MSESPLKLTFDSAAFREEFMRRVKRSRKSLGEICNWCAWRILMYCLDHTKRASRPDIMKLARVEIKIFGKTGKRLKKQRQILHPKPRFRAVYAERLRWMGINPRSLGRGEFDSKMTKALGRRLSSVSFVASGWGKALRKIIAKLPGSKGGSFKQFPAAKGDAKAARPDDWNPVTEFSNSTALNYGLNDEKSKGRVERELLRVIDAGFAAELHDMQQHAEQQIDRAMQGES